MTELEALTLSDWWCVHHRRDADLIALFWYSVDAVEFACRSGPGSTVRHGGKVMWTVPEGPALTMTEMCAVSDQLRSAKWRSPNP